MSLLTKITYFSRQSFEKWALLSFFLLSFMERFFLLIVNAFLSRLLSLRIFLGSKIPNCYFLTEILRLSGQGFEKWAWSLCYKEACCFFEIIILGLKDLKMFFHPK